MFTFPTALEVFLESPITHLWIKEENLKPRNDYLNPEMVLNYVCDFFCYEKKLILKKGRKTEQVLVRQFAMFMLRKRTNLTFKAIGEMFNKHHTTVISAVQVIKNYATYDSYIKDCLTLLENGYIDSKPITSWWEKTRYTPQKRKEARILIKKNQKAKAIYSNPSYLNQ